MKRLYIFPFLFLFISSLSSFLVAQDATEEVVEVSTVEALLALVKEGKTQEQAANDDRENKFLANKNKQASILAAEKRELTRQEKIADTLEAEYKKNEEILRVKEDAYKKELGSLVELFGHLQSSAGEAAVQFSGSLTGAEYGQDRVKFLNDLTGKMSETTELPTIREIEGLWYELTRELSASGQVVSFTTDVIDVDAAQTGKRQGGAYFSIWSMTRKLAYALGLFVGTNLVVFWGFDSLADPVNTTNSQFSLIMLAVTYSVIPALFKFVAMPLLWNYPLTEERVAQIQSEIAEENAVKQNAASKVLGAGPIR